MIIRRVTGGWSVLKVRLRVQVLHHNNQTVLSGCRLLSNCEITHLIALHLRCQHLPYLAETLLKRRGRV